MLSRAAYGLPTLGLMPSVPSWKTATEPLVAALTSPTSPAAEGYRSLRTAIQFASLDRELRIIQVTSPGASEGKSTTLANLAVVFGRVGSRVCAVDCDLRRPRLHTFFGVPNEPGFTSVLNGELPLSRTVGPTSAANVYLLASGLAPLDPSEVLATTRTKGVLTSLSDQFDIVLVDSPPTLPVTDAAVLSRHVDAVVVVVDAGRTKKRALTRAIELLRQVEAPILGLVINRADEESRYGYTYDNKYVEAAGGRTGTNGKVKPPRPPRRSKDEPRHGAPV